MNSVILKTPEKLWDFHVLDAKVTVETDVSLVDICPSSSVFSLQKVAAIARLKCKEIVQYRVDDRRRLCFFLGGGGDSRLF